MVLLRTAFHAVLIGLGIIIVGALLLSRRGTKAAEVDDYARSVQDRQFDQHRPPNNNTADLSSYGRQ
jgi:hypothetical protein